MATAAKRKPKTPPSKKVAVAKTIPGRYVKAKPKPKPRQQAQPATRERAVTDKDKYPLSEQGQPADKAKPDPKSPPPTVKEPLAGGAQGAYSATTVSVPPEDMLTEQEKDTTGDIPGVGPAAPSQHTSGPVETIEDLGIGPREPYPTGAPAGTREEVTRSQAVKDPDKTLKKEPHK